MMSNKMGDELTRELEMKASRGVPIAFPESHIDDALAPFDAAEELDWLMSLALDEALNDEEAERLEFLLRQAPENSDRWAAWQSFDQAFHEVPRVLPSVDFGEKFALRLEIQERRRRLRTGVIFGVAAVALWVSAFVGVGVLGALLWSSQEAWSGGLVHTLAYWWAAIGQFGEVFLNTFEALWAAPQTRALIAGYVVAACLILAGWFALLRRSTREFPLADAQMVEA